MNAITLHQPWATLVARGVKTIETRPSPPAGFPRPGPLRPYPGCAIEPGERVAIHAGGAAGKAHYLDSAWAAMYDPLRPNRFTESLVFGAVIATARVVEALPVDAVWGEGRERWLWRAHRDGLRVRTRREGFGITDREINCELPLGDYSLGRWGWLLEDVLRPSEPIPCKGKQGVWRLPDDVAERLGDL